MLTCPTSERPERVRSSFISVPAGPRPNSRFSSARQRPPFRPPGVASHAGERAIALIIVMICIFVLTILAGGFAYSMKVETRLARNANSEVELEWLGRSGVECAR